MDTKTPVLILNCKLGALAIMRSLGALGVPLYGVDRDPGAPAFLSKYCRERHVKAFDEGAGDEYLDHVLKIGRKLGRRSILIPTSDELSVFVCERARELQEYFIFPANGPGLMKDIISKKGMYHLAARHGVPTAATSFPESMGDVDAYAAKAAFPVMLKGIFGNRLQEKTGKKMVIVHSRDELIRNYAHLEDPEMPNLMIQEYIPGGDDQIYIFNGYFNADSDCLAAFTGHKIRQYPVHVGCASLGVCIWNREVAELTTGFMKNIGYRGILDIGYRFDPRTGEYKVLDINPRVGQAFRLFLAKNGMDVVRALYLDLTGQEVDTVETREGRRWMIEDYDIESSLDYYREGTLGLWQWIKSFKGLEEAAWFSLRDPAPFIRMCSVLAKRSFRSIARRSGLGVKERRHT